LLDLDKVATFSVAKKGSLLGAIEMKKRFSAFTIAVLLLGALATPSAANPRFTGGMISGTVTLSAANSPYNIVKKIEIPAGSRLVIEPGTVVKNKSTQPLFHIHGELDIQGSAQAPVLIESAQDIFFLSGAPKASRISVKFAEINGLGKASLVPATGNSQASNYLFEDSDFINFGDYSYIWYPESFLAQRNVFQNSPGFSIGFDARNGLPAPVFRHNLFLNKPKKTYDQEYWIQAWASYGAALVVENNSFVGGPYTAIRTKYPNSNVQVEATRNFWGTTNQATIQGMVIDSRDGLDFDGIISTEFALPGRDSQTPRGLRFNGKTSAPNAATVPAPTPTPAPSQQANSSQLTAGGTTISWDPAKFFEPSGCTRYSFSYKKSEVLMSTFDIRNRFGDVIALGALSGDSGVESLQVCDFQYEAAKGPFKVVLSSTSDFSSDFSSGGETVESEAEIKFISRSGATNLPVAKAPTVDPVTGASQVTAGGTTLSWDAATLFIPSGCTRYSFSYRQSNVLMATFDIRNRFGDVVALGLLSGASGTESLQICDFQYEASKGPFKLVLSSTSDYSGDFSSGGETLESEVEIKFLSRNQASQTTGTSSGAKTLNAGSFKGFVALYVKGYKGQRFSAKVGKDWVIRPVLTSDFVRIVEFTGPGYQIGVRMFIDGVLMNTVQVATK
jgi:hypothetical protein